MAQRKLADFISTNLAYTINTFFTNPKSFFCFIFPLQSSHYICCIHLLNQMYFPIASQCHSINYSTRRGVMEYYSIRVKWSAWTSNPLGGCTPLTADKKICVRTNNEIQRFLQLRFICLHSRNRFKMVTQARAVRKASKGNQSAPFAIKTTIVTLHTSSLSLKPSVGISRSKKSQIDATPKKKDH